MQTLRQSKGPEGQGSDPILNTVFVFYLCHSNTNSKLNSVYYNNIYNNVIGSAILLCFNTILGFGCFP